MTSVDTRATRMARPILFSAPMVRALLDGRKTQTRRIVKPQPHHGPVGQMVNLGGADWAMDDGDLSGLWTCPYGVPGDLLWVREAHALIWPADHPPVNIRESNIEYRADTDGVCFPGSWPVEERDNSERPRWSPSIHMPRWASRLTLEIADVRVERLQAISVADAADEGIQKWPCGRFAEDDYDPDPNRLAATSATTAYRLLWEHTNGERSWDANSWVWVAKFKVHAANVDAVLANLRAAA